MWKFTYEWIIVASFPITLPIVILLFLTKGAREVAQSAPLPTVALGGYAIAVTYAFLFKLEPKHWQHSGSRAREILGTTFRAMRLLIVVLSSIFIALAALVEEAPPMTKYIESSTVSVVSLNTAIAAVILSAASVAFRPYPKRVVS